jgi:transposase
MALHENREDNLFGAHITMQSFLPEDDPLAIFSKEIYCLFQDEDFKDCYSRVGRWAISPSFLAMVTLLQYRENLSDEETAQACIKRLDWKIALHLPIDEKKSFDSSTLCRFRKRLKENNKTTYIFDKIIKQVIKKGFIKKTTNQRIDATHIVSHVNRISTTDLLFRAVKCLVEEIRNKDKNIYEKEIPEYIKERYLNKFSSFGMSKDKLKDRRTEIVEDGYKLKAILENCTLNGLKQLEIMETIFSENVVVKKN